MATKKIETKTLKYVDLKEEGGLFETLRADDPIFDGKFGQNLVSLLNPGIIKGLHLHHKQTDYTACIKGNVLYVAITERKGESPLIQRFIIGEQNRILIKTPPEVWHGYQSLGEGYAILLHTMDRAYNPADVDTEERDPFIFGKIWQADQIICNS